MQIPIISGIFADGDPDLRTSYPVNMEPIPKISGVSQGYLRTAHGMLQEGTGPGICRGGIEWNGVCYRVMGTEFGSIKDGVFTSIGDVGGTGTVTLDYGFDYLVIASGGNMFLYDGTTLKQNTDTDLGTVLDAVWIDGYYITTDGEFIVSTELTDPFVVNPLKYGSSEEDADPVLAVKKLGSELYAINRHTIETFTNVGGTGFAFQVIDGTQSFRGAVGTHAVTEYAGSLAFVGNGRNEAPGVYVSASGSDTAISTAEIEHILSDYSEAQLSEVVCESRLTERRQLLYVHLPDQTLVYDAAAAQALGQPVWFILKSEGTAYRGRHFVWCDGKWTVCDTTTAAFGYTTEKTADQWGDKALWEFSTPVTFNEVRGMQCHELTLTGLTGTSERPASIGLEHTEDGRTYSQRRYVTLGSAGNRSAPIKWTRVGYFQRRAAFRFSGDSNSRFAPQRLDAVMEPMQW